MSAQTQYRITYIVRPDVAARFIQLSEIYMAEDLETAYHYARDWAKRQQWILTAVEEIQ